MGLRHCLLVSLLLLVSIPPPAEAGSPLRGFAVRQIVGIVLLVLGCGMLLCQWEGLAARPPASAQDARWVRTVDGWERSDAWHSTVISPPRLHPLVVAAGEGLLSVFALVAFPTVVRSGRSDKPRRHEGHKGIRQRY